MALFFGLLVLIGVGFYYVGIPYLTVLLLGSFGIEIVFWQALALWVLIHVIGSIFKGGKN